MSEPALWAVVMAGGSGTRFWPASRRALPKQFLSIASGEPMLAATVRRLEGLVPLERVLVVAGRAHEALVREVLPALPAENLLLEPSARNTAPCVAWAASEIARRAPDSVHVVLPADHVIEPAEAFRASLATAARAAAEEDVLVTLGIVPTRPATGYGYIEAGEAGAGEPRRVVRFVEKPDLERARAFVASGRFLWNGGIFVWRTRALLEALARHRPEIPPAFAAGAPSREQWSALPSVSVDVALLEPAAAEGRVRVVPIGYRWSDVGSWIALPEVLSGDAQENVAAGGTTLVAEDAERCIVWGEPESLTAVIGLSDVVVVRAGRATLVCPRERAEDLRALVARLAREHPGFA